MTVVYNIPLGRLTDYPQHDLIVRSAQPQVLADGMNAQQLQRVAYVQLLSLPNDIDGLIHWAPGLAIELVLEQPGVNFPQLYRYAKWLDNHPVRVAIPVEDGFEKAVKLALSLQFAVRLQIGQPDATLIKWLTDVLDDYLHRPTVAQPLEFFHSLLLAFCREEPIDLWQVQEEDPALVRYVDDAGAEQLPGKLAVQDFAAITEPASFVEHWAAARLQDGGECSKCTFFAQCRGYFKWPKRDYDCNGIKMLLQT
ncbi:MAG: hypothetical protein KDJ99_16490, partial [Candidatus Competibacteraceae bacterium]|nr:hypothetical protein [Candidatus Competibacteraceae bacterium]